MIILLLLAVAVVAVGFNRILDRYYCREIKLVDWLANCAFVGAVILAIVWLIAFPNSLGTVAELENFFDRNHAMFERAIKEHPEAGRVKTKEGVAEVYNLSYDFVKQTLDYNRDLQWYRKYQDHWFIDTFVGRVPDHLQFIEVPASQ